MSVQRLLAGEVGHRCSSPHCRAPTSGPSASRVTSSIGVAAHITAASQGGPRFDPSLTVTQRRSASNGIWLCGSCARLIDNDVDRYTVPALLRWKQQAIQDAHRALERRGNLEIAAVYEAPGLDEVRRVAFAFNRPGGWDRVHEGLRRTAPYAFEGTPRQRHAVLEAIARLATYVRAPMPDDALFELLAQLRAALPSRDDPRELALETLGLGIEAAWHVAYDLTLYCRHGLGVIECTHTLLDCIWIADAFHDVEKRERVLTRLHDLEGDALRARPPFEDAATWYRYHRANPNPGQRFPRELDDVEARLLNVHSAPKT